MMTIKCNKNTKMIHTKKKKEDFSMIDLIIKVYIYKETSITDLS